ncbi:hypothetical protein [Nitrososphaera sp.]|uniref:hypothetical protein n=1 Tax=Nitrososphaera sp. TaxID=1971748 RepID=UPI002EDB8E29
MKAHETNTALKVVVELDGKYFVQLDSTIALFLKLKHGQVMEEKMSKDGGILLTPYQDEVGNP